MAEHEQGASHWDTVYTTKDVTRVSWHQETPTTSLRLIGPLRRALIDVGAGTSNLADHLLADGCTGWRAHMAPKLPTATIGNERERVTGTPGT